ncbi:MAG: hypothetical protein AAGA25_07210 [Planctomycetota bacterium]
MGIAFGLFAFIPCMFVIASLVGLIWIWVRVGLDRRVVMAPGDALAQCGNCGYPARGALSFNCSECGADLREVGIVTPAQRRRPLGPLGFILLWTLFYPIPALALVGLLIAVGPKHKQTIESVTLTPVNSGEFTSINLDNDAYMGDWFFWWIYDGTAVSTHSLNLYIEGNNNQYEWLDVDPGNMTYDASYVSFTPPVAPSSGSTSGQTASATLDRAVLLAWMQSAGADTTKPEVIAEADELLQVIQNQPTQGFANLSVNQFSSSNFYSYPNDTPRGWWIVVVLLSLPLFWALGILLYFLVRRPYNNLPPPPPSEKYGPAQFAPPSG